MVEIKDEVVSKINNNEELPVTVVKQEELNGGYFFGNRFRFLILIISTLCLSSVFSNILTINFTIICMSPPKIENRTYTYPVYNYTANDKKILQWILAITSIIFSFPVNWICTHYGARIPFLIAGIFSNLCTGLIPLAAAYGFKWFVILRGIQGVTYAVDFAVLGVICSRWAPLAEYAKFISVLTCFAPIASFVMNFVAGYICDSSLGWPWVHYFHFSVGLIMFAAWYIFYTDDVSQNPFVSPTELAIIHKDKTHAHKFHEGFVPYCAILKDPAVWVVWTNSFADLFSSFFLYIYGPTYLKYVLKMVNTDIGVYLAIGSLSHIPVKLITGYVSDTFFCISERHKLWCFNSGAVIGPALIFLYICLGPKDSPMLTVTLFGAIHAVLGFNCGGFYKMGSLMSRQYSEFVLAVTQFFKCIVFFLAPLLFIVFIEDESKSEQWNIVFYILIVWLVASDILFCIYATVEPREFTKITSETIKKKKDLKNKEVGNI